MDQDVREFEQKRISQAYEIGEALCRKLRAPAEAATQRDAQTVFQDRVTRADQLEALLNDRSQLMIYGRVDFADSEDGGVNRGETIYVGGARLADEADDPLVISWEAPLAKAFIEPTSYGTGQAVELKRTFDGADRHLASYTEQRFVEGRAEAGGADPLLAALQSRTSGELGQVVATIQAKQYELMERPLDRNLVIQGGPGTGKTIVGLHRISVLLYRSEGSLSEADVLVVGPSPVFMKYVAPVLPGLGRNSVTQRSIETFGLLDVKVSGSDTLDARRVKGHASMARVIERYLVGRIRTPDEDLELGLDAKVPLSELTRYLEDARTSRQPYNQRRDRLREQLIEALGGVRGDRRPRGARNRGEQLAAKYSTGFENALDRYLQSRSPREVVHDLLTGPKLLAAAARGILTPAEQASLRRPTDKLADHPWSADDLPLLDEAAFQLDGLRSVAQRYEHIMLDEAQDFSPMQLRMLARRAKGSMTVLGDLAQCTSPWAPSSWIEHLEAGGIEVDTVDELSLSYRTTQPLLGFANQLLPAIDVAVEPARSVVADGDAPAVMDYADDGDLNEQLVDVVETLQVNHPDDKVGVIGDEQLLRAIAAGLDDAELDYTWAARSLIEPVTLVPATDAKGLEFDHVVVLAPEQLYRSDSVMGARLLFVALTRARNTMTLLHRDRLPGPLTADQTPYPVTPTLPAPAPRVQPPTSPPTATPTETTPPVQPAHESPSVHYVATPGGLVRLEATAGLVTLELAPPTGGAPVRLANGHAVRGTDATAWALTDDRGTVTAIVTGPDDAQASQAVIEAVMQARPDQHG
jgi:DNA helicase IV